MRPLIFQKRTSLETAGYLPLLNLPNLRKRSVQPKGQTFRPPSRGSIGVKTPCCCSMISAASKQRSS